MTQASWFRAEDKEAVKAAAEALKFSVIELQTDADRALAAGAHEGASDPSKSETAAAITTKPVSEQNMNNSVRAMATPDPSRATPAVPASVKPDSAPARETLRVGARVLAAYWNEKREFEGFWLATVKRIDRDEYTLEWFDALVMEEAP
jgi:hypothetical protein